MTDLERKAREAAVASGLDNYKHRRHDFANGYLAAAKEAEQEIEKLREELNDWRESARKAAEESCGDEKHCACVGALRHQLVRQAQRIAEADEEIRKMKYSAVQGLCDYQDATSDYYAMKREAEKLRARVAELENNQFSVNPFGFPGE